MTVLYTDIGKDRLHRRLMFLLRRAEKSVVGKCLSKASQQIREEQREKDISPRRILEFIDDSDSRARFINRQRRVNRLADEIARIAKEANLDEEDIQDALERALQKVF